jgi:hypothetical protein
MSTTISLNGTILPYVQGASAVASGGTLSVTSFGTTVTIADTTDSGTLAATFDDAGDVEVLSQAAAASLIASATNQVVTTGAGLARAIRLVDQASDAAASLGESESFTIDISGNLALTQQLDAINLGHGSSLAIIGDGNGATIDGGGTLNGL